MSERFNADIWSSEVRGKSLFRFSFRELSSLYITQIPKIDYLTFLNNIGGGLGLFMGISFPILIDYIKFFVKNLKSFCNTKILLNKNNVIDFVAVNNQG